LSVPLLLLTIVLSVSLLLLAIVLSVPLPFTDCDYAFGIFKLLTIVVSVFRRFKGSDYPFRYLQTLLPLFRSTREHPLFFFLVWFVLFMLSNFVSSRF
jgi:hypothetical protein